MKLKYWKVTEQQFYEWYQDHRWEPDPGYWWVIQQVKKGLINLTFKGSPIRIV